MCGSSGDTGLVSLDEELAFIGEYLEIEKVRLGGRLDYALEKGAAKQEGNVPLFNRAFLATVKFFGRTYDIAMIAAYKMGTLKLMDDTEKFPKMLKKRKIALLPPFGADRKIVRRIFKKSKQNKGGGK